MLETPRQRARRKIIEALRDDKGLNGSIQISDVYLFAGKPINPRDQWEQYKAEHGLIEYDPANNPEISERNFPIVDIRDYLEA